MAVIEEQRTEKNPGKIQKMNTRAANVNPKISIMILNMNELVTLIKRQSLLDWMKSLTFLYDIYKDIL